MGTACIRPRKKPRRSFWVTKHAIEKFRSRHDGGDPPQCSDKDLGNLLDSSVCSAIQAEDYEDIKDEGNDARIVKLHNVLGYPLWALIKKNSYARSYKDYPKAIVTLLEDWHVKRSKKGGRWLFERHHDGDVRIGGLSDRARNSLLELRNSLDTS